MLKTGALAVFMRSVALHKSGAWAFDLKITRSQKVFFENQRFLADGNPEIAGVS